MLQREHSLSDQSEAGKRAGRLYSGNRAIANAMAAVAVNPLILLIGLVRFGVLIRILPLDTYGAFLLLSSIVMQFDYLDGGLRQSLHRYIPEFLVHDRKPDVSRAVTATLATMMGLGLIAGGGVALFTYFGGAGIFTGNGETDGLEAGLYLAAFALFLSWPLTAFRAAIEGFNRFNEAIASRLVAEIVRTIAVIAGALAGWAVEWLFVLATVPVICQQLILAARAQYLLGIPILRIDDGTWRVFREIFHYSKWMAVGQIGGALNNSADKLVVGAILGVTAVPIYYGLRQILSATSSLAVIFNRIVLPTASHRMASEGVRGIRSLILNATRAQMAFFTPFATMIALFASPLLALWAGREYAAYAPVLQIGILLFLITATTKVLGRATSAINSEVRFLTLFGLITAIGAMTLIYVLGTAYGVGGAFLAIPAASILLYPIWYARVLRVTNISWRDYLLKGVLPGAWPALAVLVVSAPLLPWIAALDSLPVIAAAAVAWSAATMGSSFFFGLGKDMRTMILREILRERGPQVTGKAETR